LKYERFPKMLEASSPLGVIGYISAGFELRNQIEHGLIPEPDLVYIALATMGTATGLMLGIKATGLKSRIVAIDNGGKILGKKIVTFANVAKLFRETNELLSSTDQSFPKLEILESDFHIRNDWRIFNRTRCSQPMPSWRFSQMEKAES
jgi:1-aminocyclopropane-1-carboxylate deaminase/D-cysteine desulfhydrase-like pyridoxal-dependent ACC family enzyme